MTQTVLTGFAFSSYTRAAMLALEAKHVSYQFERANLRDPDYALFHPFVRVPVLTYGDTLIYETLAICVYIDHVFPGRALQPSSPLETARMFQWISVVNDYIFESFVEQCIQERFVKPMFGQEPDEAVIAKAKPAIKAGLEVFNEALGQNRYLAGEAISLADMFLAPIMVYLQATPEDEEMLPQVPHLGPWLERVGELPRFADINVLP